MQVTIRRVVYRNPASIPAVPDRGASAHLSGVSELLYRTVMVCDDPVVLRERVLNRERRIRGHLARAVRLSVAHRSAEVHVALVGLCLERPRLIRVVIDMPRAARRTRCPRHHCHTQANTHPLLPRGHEYLHSQLR